MNLSELLCSENLGQVQADEYSRHIEYNLEVQSSVDMTLLADTRVVANMMADERDCQLTDYCNNGQQPMIKPHMRKIVADWMLEVCEDQQCVPNVFHTAVNYMDRFLSQSSGLDKKYYQSLASGCLLLASKFTEVRPLTTEKLSLYTDHSVLPEELKAWELEILTVLNWELSAVTTQAFIDHFIQPSTSNNNNSKVADKVRRHAEILAATAATEYKFLMVRPSLMAAAALSAACRGLAVDYILPKQLINESQSIEILVQHLEILLETCLSNANHQIYNLPPTLPTSCTSQLSTCHKPVMDNCREETSTPTDVHQVSAVTENQESLTTLPPFHTFAPHSSFAQKFF